MANRYNQVPASVASETHFTAAPVEQLEFSRMVATPTLITTFNAGDIVPIRCFEVLPHDTYSIDVNSVIRQMTVLTPTMDNMQIDIFAFFVPNRIVNDSWKNVMGENTSGSWTAPSVSLAELGRYDTTVPVGSVADYYGYPTQGTIPAELMQQMHDLKFRGYLAIYNEYFRDQNWQPAIPFSKLNIYNGFFEARNSTQLANIPLSVTSDNISSDGSNPSGAVIKALQGEGFTTSDAQDLANSAGVTYAYSPFKAFDKPLKANKLHDMFTSVLPTPQRGPEVLLSASGQLPVVTGTDNDVLSYSYAPLKFTAQSDATVLTDHALWVGDGDNSLYAAIDDPSYRPSTRVSLIPKNLHAILDNQAILSVNEVRMSSAIQRVYELLGRGGGRYRSFVNSFFGLDTETPFDDIPVQLGHFRRNLDLYQTAQTSASSDGGTPQGNLAAFGYTNMGDKLFTRTFLEHGYVHIFAIVRHRNVYSSMLAKDNFRRNQLDFYLPQLANISEQPIYTYQINPFASNPMGVFGYQEAWVEYREEPNEVTALMRSQPASAASDSLAIWNYADDFDSSLAVASGEWLKSNSAEVLDRTLAVTSDNAPQFKAIFKFTVDKQRAMPIYSVPGADII